MDVVYTPYDPSINDDPYPVYARLRREAPIYHNPDLDFWALSRHADVSAAFTDSARYSSDHGPMLDRGAWGPQARTYLSFVAMDPPEHTRMLAIVSRAFTPRRVTLRDDLISALVADGGLTVEEIVAFIFLLIGAGSETTTHLLSAAWYWAWRNPDQRAAAFGGAITPWVEESLRYDTPAHGLARRLTEPTELHGTLVPEHAKIWLLIGSANRDESVFPDPDAYDLTRDTSRGISFGVGRHYCLGGPLARLEARVTLEELTKAVSPGYEIHEEEIRRTAHGNVRGMVSLRTTVTAASTTQG